MTCAGVAVYAAQARVAGCRGVVRELRGAATQGEANLNRCAPNCAPNFCPPVPLLHPRNDESLGLGPVGASWGDSDALAAFLRESPTPRRLSGPELSKGVRGGLPKCALGRADLFRKIQQNHFRSHVTWHNSGLPLNSAR
jgi:hypothetical protein